MPGHYACIAIIDIAFEREQLDTVQSRPVVVDGRQGVMGILVRIAMAGKVFGDGDNPLPFQSAGISKSFVCNRIRILAERAQADYRIIGIAVHIHIRGEVDMDAHLLALAGHLFPVFGYQAVVFDSAQHHVLWKTCRTGEAHRQPPLAVQRDQHRDAGGFLQTVGHLGLCHRIAFVKQDTAYLNFIDIPHQPLHIAGVGLRIGDHHKELSDTFVVAHSIKDRVYPMVHLRLVRSPVKVRCRLRQSG